ncbi:hypothetical protein ACFVU0_13380 [Streptomyces sp. NPDC058122]|uniref:hypothetical protein n=1 Tax=Streptomyces sp. NPDC058122 TaxID=3346349 RepID=UPI0036E68D0C
MTVLNEETGYSTLMCRSDEPHHTVFLHDFPLSDTMVASLRGDLADAPTTVHFVALDGDAGTVLAALREAGIDPAADYVSIQLLTPSFDNAEAARKVFEHLPHGDLAKIDLPLGDEFAPERAEYLIDVIRRSDYREQADVADRFYRLLSSRRPYRVGITTREGSLEITDDSGWYQLAGPLTPKEARLVPGGEVAYVGGAVSGTFTVDGALLATPQRPEAAEAATAMAALGGRLSKDPITLHIEAGRVTAVTSRGSLAQELIALTPLDRYGTITEVGISFNRACHPFVHGWNAASNEGRPGVHVAIGGDPDPELKDWARAAKLVHLDLMAATTEVEINGHTFMRTE